MPAIVIDHRESRSPVFRALHANPDITVTVRELPCGDYPPHESFGVERKDSTDVVLSIMDSRLYSSLKATPTTRAQAFNLRPCVAPSRT